MSPVLMTLFFFLAAPALCQKSNVERPTVQTLDQYAYQFQFQPASEALALVRDLLSERGRVELQSENNILVVVDSRSQLETILQLLREFDHPPRPVNIEIQLLRASRRSVDPSSSLDSGPSPELEAKLGRLTSYNQYQALAKTDIEAVEGRRVSYELSSDFIVQFDVGTIVQSRRLKLRDFKVLKNTNNTMTKLYNSHVNLWLERTLVLSFSQSEDAETSLVVAVTCSEPASAIEATR